MLPIKHLLKYGILSVISRAIPGKLSEFAVMKMNSTRIFKSRYCRVLLDFALPFSDPGMNLPAINVLIPSTRKDINRLKLVLDSLVVFSANPIQKVFICSPEKLNFTDFDPSVVDIEFFRDNQIVASPIEDFITKSIPLQRQGWVRQQVIKLVFGVKSNLPLLVFDADTILLRETTFIFADKTQLLQISHEYHSPYEKHYADFMAQCSDPGDFSNLSFVTHYQVFQSDIIKKFLNSEGDDTITQSVLRWLSVADFSQESPLSEYHCYGRYISAHHSERVKFETWRNFDRRDGEDLPKSIQSIIHFRSKSNHLAN